MQSSQNKSERLLWCVRIGIVIVGLYFYWLHTNMYQYDRCFSDQTSIDAAIGVFNYPKEEAFCANLFPENYHFTWNSY